MISGVGAAQPCGRKSVGDILVNVLDHYADELAEVGGRLYLSGLNEDVYAQLQRSGKLDLNETVRLVPAGETLGASTEQALVSANAWLAHTHSDSPAKEMKQGKSAHET